MKLYKHKDNKDIAVTLFKCGGYYMVEYYNINYSKVSGNKPLYIGNVKISAKKINLEDYKEWGEL